MESRAKLFGHAVHPMLVAFPLGLLATALAFDLIYLVTNNAELVVFSYWAIAAGIIGGLAAAVFGFWDWLAVPSGTRAKSIGLLHGGGNVIVTGIFIAAWWLRSDAVGPAYRPDGLPLILEALGGVLALVTGWLGGELVERLGVGVDSGAHLNAPSSLSGRPAAPSGTSRVRTPGRRGVA